MKNPLDSTRFQQDPCQSLTAAQTEELNVTSTGELREAPLGKTCEFEGKSDTRARVTIGSLNKYPYGLSATYQANEDGKWVFFEDVGLVEGYPAVKYGGIDDRPNGGCNVDVGVSDEIVFKIVIRLSTANVGTKDPCEAAAMVVGMVVRTMKANQ